MNVNGLNSVQGVTVTNTNEVMEQVRAMQAEADRSQPTVSNEIDPDFLLEPVTEESRRAAWNEEFGFNAMMNSLDYSNVSANEVNNLINITARSMVGAGRNLSEMVSFLEEQLRNLENNTDISDERRALERSILEEGFVRAMSISNQQMQSMQSAEQGTNTAAAERNAESTMHFALGVMQNVASFSDNEDIQNLITRSMEELVERSVNTRLFTLPRNDGTQSSQDAFQNILAERDAFRINMTEMFATLRTQMESGERQFPLAQSFDVSV